MNKGWLELESDPGLFTLLLQDFGVKGIQVEEIYDLQKTIDGPVYGFIFLFRWIEERRSRRKTITEEETFVTNESIVNSIFFAQQMIPNSCATHALLSVLLNCEKVNLGQTLSKLKVYSKNMSPENKGFAIGNMPDLAKAHNSHARQEPTHLPEKQQGMTVKTMEAFHFVSYVPINGRLFELDGLKPYPIDHGPWDKCEDWTEKFRRVITERLGMATGGEPYHDIRFNLMAVVPDKCQLYEHKLSTLKTNRQIVLEALQQMVRVTTPGLTAVDKERCLAAVKKRDSVEKLSSATREAINSAMSQQCHAMSLTKNTLNKGPLVMKLESNSNAMCTVSTSTVPLPNSSLKLETAKRDNDIEMTNTDIQPVSVAVATDAVNQSQLGTTIRNDSIQIKSPLSADVVRPTVTIEDMTKPLTIETKFVSESPGPSSESTDTASEVGSCFSSPSSGFGASCQNSPNVGSDHPGESPDLDVAGSGQKIQDKDSESGSSTKSRTKFSSHQGFKPKDLLALLKNVEKEITLCENNLRDEKEKMNKYKIDDCRRTHNYDQFLCTFLSMLAEQGHLAELVQQHSLIKKRVPGKLTRVSKLSNVAAKRKRSKAKRRR